MRAACAHARECTDRIRFVGGKPLWGEREVKPDTHASTIHVGRTGSCRQHIVIHLPIASSGEWEAVKALKGPELRAAVSRAFGSQGLVVTSIRPQFNSISYFGFVVSWTS